MWLFGLIINWMAFLMQPTPLGTSTRSTLACCFPVAGFLYSLYIKWNIPSLLKFKSEILYVKLLEYFISSLNKLLFEQYMTFGGGWSTVFYQVQSQHNHHQELLQHFSFPVDNSFYGHADFFSKQGVAFSHCAWTQLFGHHHIWLKVETRALKCVRSRVFSLDMSSDIMYTHESSVLQWPIEDCQFKRLYFVQYALKYFNTSLVLLC